MTPRQWLADRLDELEYGISAGLDRDENISGPERKLLEYARAMARYLSEDSVAEAFAGEIDDRTWNEFLANLDKVRVPA